MFNGKPEIIDFYGGGFGGGAGQGCTIHNTDPVPVTHGGVQAGQVIAGMDSCEVLEAILFPYQAPSFTSFYIQGESTHVEIGYTVTGGVRTFKWSTSNSQNVTANSLSISDVTTSTVLGSGLANDGTEDLDIGSDITNTSSGAQHRWRISGTNSQNGTFSRDFTITWLPRVYWGYNENDTIDETAIKNLSTSALKSSYAGTYNFTNPDSAVYYYIVYPNSFGSFQNWIDTDTGFAVDYADNGTVDVTNDYGVTVTYRVFRTTYQQNSNLNSQMS